MKAPNIVLSVVFACAAVFALPCSTACAADSSGAHVFARRDNGTNIVSRLVPDGTDVATAGMLSGFALASDIIAVSNNLSAAIAAAEPGDYANVSNKAVNARGMTNLTYTAKGLPTSGADYFGATVNGGAEVFTTGYDTSGSLKAWSVSAYGLRFGVMLGAGQYRVSHFNYNAGPGPSSFSSFSGPITLDSNGTFTTNVNNHAVVITGYVSDSLALASDIIAATNAIPAPGNYAAVSNAAMTARSKTDLTVYTNTYEWVWLDGADAESFNKHGVTLAEDEGQVKVWDGTGYLAATVTPQDISADYFEVVSILKAVNAGNTYTTSHVAKIASAAASRDVLATSNSVHAAVHVANAGRRGLADLQIAGLPTVDNGGYFVINGVVVEYDAEYDCWYAQDASVSVAVYVDDMNYYFWLSMPDDGEVSYPVSFSAANNYTASVTHYGLTYTVSGRLRDTLAKASDVAAATNGLVKASDLDGKLNSIYTNLASIVTNLASRPYVTGTDLDGNPVIGVDTSLTNLDTVVNLIKEGSK